MPKAKRRPNILFLMSDEHRADIAGYEGNPVVHTPVLDELARTGAAFQNCYTPYPVCVPSRQCMMAGQLPKTCHCEKFESDLTPGYPTFAKLFSQYAYHTVACGKLHHRGVDQNQGWTHRIGCHDCIEPRFIEGRREEEFDLYKSDLADGWWPIEKEIRRAGIARSRNCIDDDYTVLGALNYIEKYFNDAGYDKQLGHQPLFLKVSLVHPHYPFFTTEEKFNYYLNRVRPFLDQPAPWHPVLADMQVVPGKDVTKREVQRATAAYYGMVESMDTYFGQVLEMLDFVGQNLDDWVILYTSDHGELLGEHNRWWKASFFEGSVRVPLILRYPGMERRGMKIPQNVSLCDLFATLCDLCGIPIPDGLDSRSLLPLLEGKTDDWDDEAVSQIGSDRVMIKKGSLKYQQYPGFEEVLFDLERDPAEQNNFASDSAYAQQMEAFRHRAAELGFSQ